MTVLLALCGAAAARDDHEIEGRLRHALHGAAGSIIIHRPAADVLLGVNVPTWDRPAIECVASDARYTVVAHAWLGYRSAFDEALRVAGAPPLAADVSPAHVILTALRVWGEAAVHKLEGEFAFVVWDAERRTLLAARDHGGARPLFHAAVGAGIVVASTLRLTRSIPGVGDRWNLLAIAEDAADIDLAFAEETAWSSVHRLPAGHALRWSAERPVHRWRWWEIPIFERDSGMPFEEGAAELRRLIADAVAERTDLSRGTAVMLSGGYDSTAVFAAGSSRFASDDGVTPIRAVSLSHPPGDPGREDELIEATTSRWRTTPLFIDCAGIPALEPSAQRAARRDEPFYHTYELWNRALARGCAAQDARIALNGNGGDPWFSTSPIFLADLLRRGRLLTFRREWRVLLGRLTPYRLFKVAVQPNLPGWVLAAATALRGGRPLPDPHVRAIPSWMSDEMRASHDLRARRWQKRPRRPSEGLSAAERTWFLHAPFAERTTALVFSICQAEGVEVRTPLLDARVIRFAATRPRWESNSQRQNKHLLRRSMAGLLPDDVIAPRSARTGLPATYLRRTLQAHLAEARAEFGSGMVLAKIGIVDHRKLWTEVDSYLSGRLHDDERAAALVAATQAEWWLRSVG